MDSLQLAFPEFVIEEVSEEIYDKDEEILYLWDTNLEVYSIYKLLLNYLGEYYSINSAILLALITDKGLDLSTSLQEIAYIHAGYVEVVLPRKEEQDG